MTLGHFFSENFSECTRWVINKFSYSTPKVLPK